MVKVKLLGFDDRGKVRLSMKMVDQETGEEIKREKSEGDDDGDDDKPRRRPRRKRDDD